MTTIVGLVANARMFLAGDSLASGSGSAVTLKRPKVVHKLVEVESGGQEPLLIGVAGSFRVAQLVSAIEPPPSSSCAGDFEYIAIDLVEAIRQELGNKGAMVKDREEETATMQMLIGYRGCLYEIQADFSVIQVDRSYHAVGSGADFVLGAWYAMRDKPIEYAAWLRVAFDVATHFDVGTRLPVYGLTDSDELLIYRNTADNGLADLLELNQILHGTETEAYAWPKLTKRLGEMIRLRQKEQPNGNS